MKSHLMAGAALAAAVVAIGALSAGRSLAQGSDPAPAAAPVSPADDGPADAKAWTGYAKLGYHLDPHWRLELQGGYRDKQPAVSPAVDPVGGAMSLNRALGAAGQCANLWAQPCAEADGSGQIYAYSGKLIFDFAPDNRWFDPFVGVAARLTPNTNPRLEILGFGSGDTPLAYQAMAGIAFRPSNRVHLDITYRWTGSGGLSITNAPLPGLAGRYQDQTVALGIRYLFDTPPAAPAPIAYAPPTALTAISK